jgi:hypothetical protein
MTAHIGWRLVCSRPADSGTVVAFATLEMRATVGGADQCVGGTPLSSSDFDANVGAPGYAKANAFDGNAATAWASGAGGYTAVQYLGYLFAAPVEVRQLRLVSRAETPQWQQVPDTMKLQYTNDVTGVAGWTDYADFGTHRALWSGPSQSHLLSGFHDDEAATATVRTNVLAGWVGSDDALGAGTIRTAVNTGAEPDRMPVGTLRTSVLAGGSGAGDDVSAGTIRFNVLYRPGRPATRPQIF